MGIFPLQASAKHHAAMTIGKVAIFIACLALAAETAPVPESEELTLYEQQQELYNSMIVPETGLYEQQQELYNSLLQKKSVAKKATAKKVEKKKPTAKKEAKKATTKPAEKTEEKHSGPYSKATEGTVKAEGQAHKKAMAEMKDENNAKLLKHMKVDAARDKAIKEENQKQDKQIEQKEKKYT